MPKYHKISLISLIQNILPSCFFQITNFSKVWTQQKKIVYKNNNNNAVFVTENIKIIFKVFISTINDI